jgi:indoleamine 2,3-dioxygenase
LDDEQFSQQFSQDSFRCLNTMTGTKDEEWFYCTSTAIQTIGGPLVLSSYHILAEAVPQQDFKAVLGFLEDVSERVKQMAAVLQRAPENLCPQVFYNDMRPLLQGFGQGFGQGTKLTQGLVYEGVKEYGGKPQTFGGASAAQSSCIPLLDRILDIQQTGDAKSFCTDMLQYMPRLHREYLELLGSQPSLRDAITRWSKQAVDTMRLHLIIMEFNTCIDRMVEFRRGHWRLVGTHIIAAKAQAEKRQGGCVVGPGEGTGTGGSPLNAFLNSTIEATLAAKIQLG